MNIRWPRYLLILATVLAPHAIAAKRQAPQNFNDLLAIANESKSKKTNRVIRKFIKRRGLPLVEKNQIVFLLEHKNHQIRPRILHDLNGFGALYGKDDPALGQMSRLGETHWYFASVSLLGKSRMMYKFKVGDQTFTDPHNPHSLTIFNERCSIAQMPGFAPRFSKKELAQVKPGRIEKHRIKLEGEEQEIFVYVPRSYDLNRDRALPVMYVNDGGLFRNDGDLQTTLDALMFYSRCNPFLVVMSDATDRREQYRGNSKYRNWYVYDLVSFIDRNYKTLQSADKRVILGGSRGGLMALDAVFHYSNRVAGAAVLAPALSPTNVLRDLKKSRPKPMNLFVAVGRLDARWKKDGEDLRKVLRSKKIQHKAIEYEEGHNVHAWVNLFPEVAAYFFPFTPQKTGD